MMAADLNLQVWLDTLPGTQPAVTIPYVQSAQDQKIHYTLRALKQGRSGTSRVQQSGEALVRADQATPLGRLSISASPADTCRIELILSRHGQAVGTWQFNCPHSIP